VRRRVVLPQIGLDFYNPAGKTYAPLLPYQDLPQEFAAHAPRITAKERALKRTNALNVV
jgi:hypothetical protein